VWDVRHLRIKGFEATLSDYRSCLVCRGDRDNAIKVKPSPKAATREDTTNNKFRIGVKIERISSFEDQIWKRT
jgi:hypothetical protein